MYEVVLKSNAVMNYSVNTTGNLPDTLTNGFLNALLQFHLSCDSFPKTQDDMIKGCALDKFKFEIQNNYNQTETAPLAKRKQEISTSFECSNSSPVAFKIVGLLKYLSPASANWQVMNYLKTHFNCKSS